MNFLTRGKSTAIAWFMLVRAVSCLTMRRFTPFWIFTVKEGRQRTGQPQFHPVYSLPRLLHLACFLVEI